MQCCNRRLDRIHGPAFIFFIARGRTCRESIAHACFLARLKRTLSIQGSSLALAFQENHGPFNYSSSRLNLLDVIHPSCSGFDSSCDCLAPVNSSKLCPGTRFQPTLAFLDEPCETQR
jgi:hypothetical protein